MRSRLSVGSSMNRRALGSSAIFLLLQKYTRYQEWLRSLVSLAGCHNTIGPLATIASSFTISN